MNRRSDALWCAFQLAGVAFVHAVPVMALHERFALFAIVFAVLELAGIKWRFPLTWTVRSFLARAEPGWRGVPRLGLVFVWVLWLLIMWYKLPLPDLVLGLVGLGFSLWIIKHMYEKLGSKREQGQTP